MEFKTQLIFYCFLACIFCILIGIPKVHKLKRAGLELGWLPYKIMLLFGTPIMSIPIIMNRSLSMSWKLLILSIGTTAMLSYGWVMVSVERKKKGYEEKKHEEH